MRLIFAIIILLILSGVVVFTLSDTPTDISAQTITIRPVETDTSQFARVYGPRPLEFPADLGTHPEYQTEWWYYTGNLADAEGHRYGFQLTFFRRALSVSEASRPSEWASDQLYFAHFTVSDIHAEGFYPAERFSRGGAGLAGAQAAPYHVWLGDWEAVESDTEPGVVYLRAEQDGVALNLRTELLKPIALQGEQGYSPKSGQEGNASYYYSFTRMSASGTITTPASGPAEVEGFAWKDHEWGTSALGPGAVGWDWFSLQLDDNREIMFFHIRQADGSIEPASKGLLVSADGETRVLRKDEVDLTVLDRWESPQSGGTYPVKWQFSLPAENIDLTITALMPAQELNVSTTYWEGAVRAEGTQTGYGYVEMTGYAGSMEGRF